MDILRKNLLAAKQKTNKQKSPSHDADIFCPINPAITIIPDGPKTVKYNSLSCSFYTVFDTMNQASEIRKVLLTSG